jgi:hypothetical protein
MKGDRRGGEDQRQRPIDEMFGRTSTNVCASTSTHLLPAADDHARALLAAHPVGEVGHGRRRHLVVKVDPARHVAGVAEQAARAVAGLEASEEYPEVD